MATGQQPVFPRLGEFSGLRRPRGHMSWGSQDFYNETKSESDKPMTPSDEEKEWTAVSEKKSEEKTVEIPIKIIKQR